MDDHPSSPVKTDKSFDSDRSVTPPLPRTVLFPVDDDDKPSIEPKNLLHVRILLNFMA